MQMIFCLTLVIHNDNDINQCAGLMCKDGVFECGFLIDWKQKVSGTDLLKLQLQANDFRNYAGYHHSLPYRNEFA